jgi:hypothetical protein
MLALFLGSSPLLVPQARSADLVALSPQTWERYASEGKEADAIYGDFAMSNGFIKAVIAHPKRGRNANMTVRDVGGCLIDLTVRKKESDQLSAFYPGAGLRVLNFAGVEVESPTTYEVAELDRLFVQAKRVTLRLVASPREKEPDVEVAYTLDQTWSYLLVTTTFTNRRDVPVEIEMADAMRADGTFEFSPDGPADLFWAYDKHFGQAYGVLAEGRGVLSATSWQRLLRYPDKDGKVTVRLAPGGSYRLARRIIPGSNLFDVRRDAQGILSGKGVGFDWLEVKDTAGKPVVGADVVVEQEGKRFAWGRTDDEGRILVYAGEGQGALIVSGPGYGTKSLPTAGPGHIASVEVTLPEAGTVRSNISDEQGGFIPCKVQFLGTDGTKSPDFGPDTGEFAVKNVVYSPLGQFRRALDPGNYDVIISHGPEYDAVFTKIKIVQGQETRLDAKVIRTVKTDGWISADFHSHSSPSGDNTSSQLGRVLNLLCEHIEFAPCTEHNRLSTYDPHLRRLLVPNAIATCVGIELTGSPLPLNHQNAFPLVLHSNAQDGGAPTPDADPAIQIERLALWDQGSDKLVQLNHPDIGWMFRDRDGNGRPDGGFSGMFGRIDVIEVHPPHWIFGGPTASYEGRHINSPIFNWLQLLNQGRRIPGVVNTDAHYNFHGSGWLRNYVKSPTDDPARVKTLDVVHAAERGNLVMTTGPFLEVSMKAQGSPEKVANPGDDLAAPGGKVLLRVRVQCPNWFDVDRVQVFTNGRPDERLNFTRKRNPDRFTGSTVKFDQEIPLALTDDERRLNVRQRGGVRFDQEIPINLAHDAHVIVAAIGEHSRLGPVMGPDHASDAPVAVSNPIFVDVDGGGFKPNGDPLGKLAVKGEIE